jgi:hypothetical protein
VLDAFLGVLGVLAHPPRMEAVWTIVLVVAVLAVVAHVPTPIVGRVVVEVRDTALVAFLHGEGGHWIIVDLTPDQGEQLGARPKLVNPTLRGRPTPTRSALVIPSLGVIGGDANTAFRLVAFLAPVVHKRRENDSREQCWRCLVQLQILFACWHKLLLPSVF